MRRFFGISLLTLWLCRTAFAQTPSATPADTSVTAHQPLARDTWLGKDKADHMMASAFLTGAQYYALHRELDWSHERSARVAIGSTLVLGLGKEVYDHVSGKGTPSVKDLAADILGIAVAALLLSK